MTTTQFHLFNAFYLILLIVVAILTRATLRRIVGALAGGVAAGVVALGIIALGEKVGWWHFIFPRDPYFLTVMLIGLPLIGFIFLITWRIARRFGGRGLAVVSVAVAIIGPPRDYFYMRMFPEWGSYGPGVAPFFAVSATYVIVVLVGHGVMRLFAGPAGADRLARRPWERPDLEEKPASDQVAHRPEAI
jgi:hypothetical protein